MTPLAGQRALVTGAAHRVGRAIALELGRAGMSIVVHYHSSAAEAVVTCRELDAIGSHGYPLRADLGNADEARQLVDASVDALGGLDLLVSSAATFPKIPFDEIDDAAWRDTLALNLHAPFVLAHRAAPALRKRKGSIVMITCASATLPFRGYLPYVVSKGALRQLVRTLAIELAPEIRVNAIAPGTVAPPLGMPGTTIERLARRIPLGRIGTAEDVARAVAFLAASPFVTGQEIGVDGGRTVAGFESG